MEQRLCELLRQQSRRDYDPSNIKGRKILGYDRTEDGLAINEREAEVVRYILQRRLEYAENPPSDLVYEVIEDYAGRGKRLSYEDAQKRVSADRILERIRDEALQNWPDVFRQPGPGLWRSTGAYPPFAFQQKRRQQMP